MSLRILFVSRMCPWPRWDGESIRTGSLLRALANDHRVTLITRARDAFEAEAVRRERHRFEALHVFTIPQQTRAAIACKALLSPRGWTLPLRATAFCFERIGAATERLLRSGGFDCLILDHTSLACYLSRVPAGFPGLRVLNLHNLESMLQRQVADLTRPRPLRALLRADAVRMRRFELRALGRFDAVFSSSPADSAVVRAIAPRTQVIDVPNGVVRVPPPDARDRSARERHRMLFVGTLNYVPNEDGLLWFIEHVLPLVRERVPGAVLTIAGHRPTSRLIAALGSGIELHESPARLGSFYLRAAVSVVPLRAGSGTRHKILESLAHGVPVVSTGRGAEGLELQAGTHYVRADTPELFAAGVVLALEDAPAGAAQVARALPVIRERYAWETIGAYASRRLAALADVQVARQAAAIDSVCPAPAG